MLLFGMLQFIACCSISRWLGGQSLRRAAICLRLLHVPTQEAAANNTLVPSSGPSRARRTSLLSGMCVAAGGRQQKALKSSPHFTNLPFASADPQGLQTSVRIHRGEAQLNFKTVELMTTAEGPLFSLTFIIFETLKLNLAVPFHRP